MSEQAKILVADDEKINRMVLQDILLTQGYEIIQAADGVEALERARKDTPDVVLLDLHMPKMNGLEVTKQMKADKQLRHIPLIIVTGLDDMDLRVKALRFGADDFLVKPPHMAELIARVRALVKVKAYHDHMVNYQKELQKEVSKRTHQLKKALVELKKTHHQLKNSSLQTIYSLSRASEYKDEDTAEHIQRISYYAAAVGRRLGLDDNAIEMILYASPMHDIGKIGIPDRILLKPGKLDPQEWAIMKEHTTFGDEILSKGTNGFIKFARVIALTHHEKWDGSGYPKGLKGEKIPIGGRITAVADVFDALTSNRPYKKAFPIDKSLKIMQESSGSHFDPEVVGAFFKAQDEILEIRNRFQDKGSSILVQLSDEKLER